MSSGEVRFCSLSSRSHRRSVIGVPCKSHNKSYKLFTLWFLKLVLPEPKGKFAVAGENLLNYHRHYHLNLSAMNSENM